MTLNCENMKISKEAVVDFLRYCPRICLGSLGKTTKTSDKMAVKLGEAWGRYHLYTRLRRVHYYTNLLGIIKEETEGTISRQEVKMLDRTRKISMRQSL